MIINNSISSFSLKVPACQPNLLPSTPCLKLGQVQASSWVFPLILESLFFLSSPSSSSEIAHTSLNQCKLNLFIFASSGQVTVFPSILNPTSCKALPPNAHTSWNPSTLIPPCTDPTTLLISYTYSNQLELLGCGPIVIKWSIKIHMPAQSDILVGSIPVNSPPQAKPAGDGTARDVVPH